MGAFQGSSLSDISESLRSPRAALFNRATTWIPVLLLLAAMAALAIDVPFAHWIANQNEVYFGVKLRRTLQAAAPFGEGGGVLLVAVAIYALDLSGRRRIPRVVAAAIAGGLVSNLGKLVVARQRPYVVDYSDVVNAWGTFTAWFPWLSTNSLQQSFPSAHTATAAALAVVLTSVYSRGGWLFRSMVVLVALQRVETGAHFVSDVLSGAAIGLLVAQAFIGRNRLARWFEGFERGASELELDSAKPSSQPHRRNRIAS